MKAPMPDGGEHIRRAELEYPGPATRTLGRTGGNIAWHAISQQPLAEPKIKSTSVHVDVLER